LVTEVVHKHPWDPRPKSNAFYSTNHSLDLSTHNSKLRSHCTALTKGFLPFAEHAQKTF